MEENDRGNVRRFFDFPDAGARGDSNLGGAVYCSESDGYSNSDNTVVKSDAGNDNDFLVDCMRYGETGDGFS